LWRKGKEDIAQTTLRQAKERVSAALDRSPNRPIDLGNLGYIEFLLGDLAQARIRLTQAIALGGETIRLNELEDAKIHSLPQDQTFKTLVESIAVEVQDPS
jgi:hypothetical protein